VSFVTMLRPPETVGVLVTGSQTFVGPSSWIVCSDRVTGESGQEIITRGPPVWRPIASVRDASLRTVVTALAVLLAGLGSPSAQVTEAVSVKTPSVGGRVTILSIAAVALLKIVIWPETIRFVRNTVPAKFVAETNTSPAGRVFVMRTFVTIDGPLFEITRV
jgi:hypothetical protein